VERAGGEDRFAVGLWERRAQSLAAFHVVRRRMRALGLARAPARSDHPVVPEPRDLRGVEPQLAEDLLGVLAEIGGGRRTRAGVLAILNGTPSARKGPADGWSIVCTIARASA